MSHRLIIGLALLGIGGYLAYKYLFGSSNAGSASTSSASAGGYVNVPLFGRQPVLSSIPKGTTIQLLQGTGYEAVFGAPSPANHNIPQIIGVYPV
jgi:hypothetical protein